MNDEDVSSRLERIESLLETLVARQVAKDFYTTEEFARQVGKSEMTIREHCRHGRINARKKQSGRGAHAAWTIAHDELRRYERDGLLPVTQKPC